MRGSPQLRGSIFEHSLRFCIILDSIYDYTSKRFCKGLLFLQCPPCAFSSSVRKQIFFKHSTLNYQHRFMCFPLRFFCRLKRKKIFWIKMVNEKEQHFTSSKNSRYERNNTPFSIFSLRKGTFFRNSRGKSVYNRGVLLMRGFI